MATVSGHGRHVVRPWPRRSARSGDRSPLWHRLFGRGIDLGHGLVIDLVGLGRAAQLGELCRDGLCLAAVHDGPDRGLAAIELLAEPVAIGLLDAQALVVERPQGGAADDPSGTALSGA